MRTSPARHGSVQNSDLQLSQERVRARMRISTELDLGLEWSLRSAGASSGQTPGERSGRVQLGRDPGVDRRPGRALESSLKSVDPSQTRQETLGERILLPYQFRQTEKSVDDNKKDDFSLSFVKLPAVRCYLMKKH